MQGSGETMHVIDDTYNLHDHNSTFWTENIMKMDIDQLMKVIIQPSEKKLKINDKLSASESLNIGFDLFFDPSQPREKGLPIQIDIGEVERTRTFMIDRLCEAYHRSCALEKDNECDFDDDEIKEVTLATRINRMIDRIQDAWRVTFSVYRIHDFSNNPNAVPVDPESDPSIYRASTIKDVQELKPFQQAMLQLLKDLYDSQIRRYKEQCCREIKTKDGASTRAWEAFESIQDYVYSVGKKEQWYELWKNMTMSTSTHSDLIRHLSKTKDMQFPEIKKHRQVWSFTNGIFIGKELVPDKSTEEDKHYRAIFYPYTSKEFKTLDRTIVSCKYFNREFNNYNDTDWRNIPTPNFDKILKYQKFEKEVIEWIYVLCGRLCYDVNEIDKWQCIPFLKGVAQSGKSTIITKVCRKFYTTEDVRTLSNNVERKFGLSSIYDSYMFIAPEIKGDLALEQAEFQSVVSGEDVSIAVKHEKAKTFVWKSPGILGGNEIPGWRDNSGSVLRRLITVDFRKKVKEADPTLEDRLEEELPNILQKCVRAYLEKAQAHKNDAIWNILPPYFEKVKTQVAAAVSPLLSFMESSHIEYGEDKKCPLSFFKDEFAAFCMKEGKSRTINSDIWAGPFGERGIGVEKLKEDENTLYTRCGITQHQPKTGTEHRNSMWVIGLDIVNVTPQEVVPQQQVYVETSISTQTMVDTDGQELDD